jgi:phage terminase Nu1 subunit (DNA packaging protein)
MNVMSTERGFLNSWKEIANYTGRGVRTVQRWESRLGFPVHRLYAGGRSPVMAFTAEVDHWLATSVTNSASKELQPHITELPLNHEATAMQIYDPVVSRHLASIKDLRASLDTLRTTVQFVRMQRATNSRVIRAGARARLI